MLTPDTSPRAAPVERSPDDPPADALPPADSFSVVIPALDEAADIAEVVAELLAQPRVHEVLVVDGGSRDATVARARAAGARVLHATRGRGAQMNAGARAARAPHLLFLHADCRLPPDAWESMQDVFARGHEAGVFAIDYLSPHPLLRLVSILSRLRAPWTEFGEATLFVRRQRFESLGGYREWPLFEDVEILRRLRRLRVLGRARSRVWASPRRYVWAGIWRQQLLNVALYGLYRLGVSSWRLQRLYERRGRVQAAPRRPIGALRPPRAARDTRPDGPPPASTE